MLVSAPTNAANHWFPPDISETSVPKADCGPGSRPEPGLQGDVSAEDRLSGRSMRGGYHCNLTKLGNVTGAGGGIVSASFEHCSYTGSLFPPGNNFLSQPGVQVIDASDPPRKPRVVGSLTDTAMRGGTWETLKVNKKRKLLAATGGSTPVGVRASSRCTTSPTAPAPPSCSTGTAAGSPTPSRSPHTRAAGRPTDALTGRRVSRRDISARSTSPIPATRG